MEPHNVIALGFFDGVHLGHQALLRMAKHRAEALGLPAMALSFAAHPSALITGKQIPLLSTPAERERLLRASVERVVFLPFDRAMLLTEWDIFLDEILMKQYHAAAVVCGYDYRFGHGGQGTAQKLQVACEQRGIGCDVLPPVTLDGITVSSTHIRSLLAEGQVAQARRFLGHPYALTGTVIHGAGLGRTMGSPTANLRPDPSLLLPCRGVYITAAHTAQGQFPALTNIGCRPTVGGTDSTVESWLLGYEGSLYGQPLRLEFLEYLRPEKKFDTISALQAEIRDNAQAARAYFAQCGHMESEEQA